MDSLAPEDAQFLESLEGMPSTGRLSISPRRNPAQANHVETALVGEQTPGDNMLDDSYVLKKPTLSFLNCGMNKPAGGFQFGPQIPMISGQFSRIPTKASPKSQNDKTTQKPTGLQTSSKLGGSLLFAQTVAGDLLRGKGAFPDTSVSEPPQKPPMPVGQPPDVEKSTNADNKYSPQEEPSIMIQRPPFLSPTTERQVTGKSPTKHQAPSCEAYTSVPKPQESNISARVVSPVNLASLSRNSNQSQHSYPVQQRRPDNDEIQAREPSPIPSAPISNRARKEGSLARPYVSTKKLAGGTRTSQPTQPPNRTREQVPNRAPMSPPPPQNSRTVNIAQNYHAEPKNFEAPSHRHYSSRHQACHESQQSTHSSEGAPSSPGHQLKAATNFTSSMAGMINQYNQQQRAALEKQRMKYRKHIKSLERDLAKSEDRNAHYHAKIEAKSKELKELQTASDEMADKIRELEFKLEASEIQPRQLSDKIRELEKRLEESECRSVLLADKIHELKTHYNKAITEQQDLYTRTKDRCEITIKELRDMARAKKTIAEMAVQKAETIREEMLQKVRQEISGHKSEALELDRRIELLEKQLEEKDNEVAQQRETIRVLSEKTHDLEASSTGFQALTAQNEEILQKISDQGSQTDKHEKESAKETHDKLDSISTRLDAVAKSFSTHPELITVMQETQTRAFESITAKLNAIEESGVLVNKNTSQLSVELGTHMSKVWQRLDSQIETLTQQLAQRAEENGMLSALCKEKDAAYERLEQELEDLQNTSAEQIEDINALQERNQENQLAMDATREESQKHLQEILQRLQASEKEVKKFELEVMSKEDNIAKLGEMLKGKEEEYATRLENSSAEIVKLGQLLGEKDRAAQEAVKNAVQLSLQEFKSRMEEAGAQAKELVEEKQEQIKSLEVQLEELKKSLHNKEQNERRDACTVNSMRQALCAVEAKEKVSTEKLAVQCAKYDELEIQIRDRMNTVNTELEAAKRRVAEYKGELEAAKRRAAKFEDESHHQRARAQALFSSVREWTRDEGLATESFDQICDVNKSPEDLATGLSQALARMLLSQRSQVAHRRQGDNLLLDGNESQFNSSNMDHPVLLSPDGSISAAHPELSGPQEDDVPALTKLPRRVVVRSPANDPDEPIPPSVSEEKARRRDGQQPKSIMKAGVARADQNGSVTIQDNNIEEASKDGSLHRSLADHSSSSSPGQLVNDIAPKASTPPGLIVQPTATAPKPELSGQNKRKREDEPGPDIFLSRVRKPRASQMTEDIETETLAQLEEIVGSKRRAAKKRVTRTYGTQKPPESPPDNEGQHNILPTLQSEVRPQTRHLTAHQQTQGPSQPSEAQELPQTGGDSTGTQLSNNIAMEKPASSVRQPPLRRNLRRR